MVARDVAFLAERMGNLDSSTKKRGGSMSEIRPQPDASPAATPEEPERGERAGVPEPSRIESWLRTLAGFENARVVGVEPLTDGLSNVTCRLKVTEGPVTTAVLRIQPTRGIFEPYDVLREGRVLSHLAGAAVPVPGLLAAESDPRFFGSPFLLLESIDAPHMPAPEADFATFAADLPAFAAAVAGIHALDWRAAGLDFLGVPSSPVEAFRGKSRRLRGGLRHRTVVLLGAVEDLLPRSLAEL
jgi:aminoglycoside phosphotransferase (APT) family kinase protein